MTDTSLPANQTPKNDSYVDSYAPPAAPAQQSAPSSAQQSGQQPTQQPPQPQAANNQSTPSTPSNDGGTDPLAELEKALADYEARHKAAGQKQPPAEAPAAQPAQPTTAQPTAPAASADSGKDPLAELERVLDEYEARYKQKQATAGDSQPADKPTAQPTPEPVAKPTPQPTPEPTPEPAAAQPTSQPASAGGESIEEQNIFELLGVKDAEQSEKEAFLDELQQALWDDFLEKDLPLLVDENQLKEITALQTQGGQNPEQLIKKVEELVPDIEDIMLEKALGLKEEMVWERVAGMKEYYAQKPADLTKISEAEQKLRAGHWKSGTQLLNTLAA